MSERPYEVGREVTVNDNGEYPHRLRGLKSGMKGTVIKVTARTDVFEWHAGVPTEKLVHAYIVEVSELKRTFELYDDEIE